MNFLEKKLTYLIMDYSKKKLTELRSICKEYNIKSSGTKIDMIKRIKLAEFQKSKSFNKKMSLYLYKDNLYKSITSYKKIYSFIIKKQSSEIIGKLNNTNNKIEDLEKEDLDYCRFNNLPFLIPVNIKGEYDTHRIRKIVEDDDDDIEEEYNDLND